MGIVRTGERTTRRTVHAACLSRRAQGTLSLRAWVAACRGAVVFPLTGDNARAVEARIYVQTRILPGTAHVFEKIDGR